MNWAKFKDLASHMYLAGSVVASMPLTQQVAGSIPFNNKYFLSLNSVKTSRKNSNERQQTKDMVLWAHFGCHQMSQKWKQRN